MRPDESPRQGELTDGERKAYVMGVLRGLELGADQLRLARLRVAGKSLTVEPPKEWPQRGGE